MEFDEKMTAKAVACASPEELLALAKREGTALSREDARRCWAALHPPEGELTDQELADVAGGGCGGGGPQTAAPIRHKLVDGWRVLNYTCTRCNYNCWAVESSEAVQESPGCTCFHLRCAVCGSATASIKTGGPCPGFACTIEVTDLP